MKYIFLFIFLFSNTIFAEVISPSWYPKKTNIHKVYSYAKTIAQAKINASKQIQNDLNITNVDIDDFIITRKELFENKVFIEVEYINETIENQIKNRLKTYAFKQEEQINILMTNTIFFKDIFDEFNYYPNIEIHDKFLYFNNDRFLIKKYEMSKFYATFLDDNITLDIKDELQNKENFFINIETTYDGYITLARVYKDEFSILFKNKKSNNSIVFPSFKISDGMQINIDDSIYNEELLSLAIVCEDIKDFKYYSMLLDIKDSNNTLNFTDFINEINDCKITSKTTDIIK